METVEWRQYQECGTRGGKQAPSIPRVYLVATCLQSSKRCGGRSTSVLNLCYERFRQQPATQHAHTWPQL